MINTCGECLQDAFTYTAYKNDSRSSIENEGYLIRTKEFLTSDRHLMFKNDRQEGF